MTRRKSARALPVGLLVGLGLGFGLLALGIAALFGIIVDERDAALRAVDRDEAEVERVATDRLRARLAHELAGHGQPFGPSAGGLEREVAAALADPFAASGELLLVEHGVQILPRHAGAGADSAARELLATLASQGTQQIDGETLQERLRLIQGLPGSYAAWLEHRRRFVIRVDRELASTLYALERLDAAHALPPDLAQALLRDGIAGGERPIEGWFATLLAARGRLSEADFEHLLTRATSLGKRLLVRVDDVLARAGETATTPPAGLLAPAPCDTANPIGGGYQGCFEASWVATIDVDRRLGKRVDRDAFVEVIARDLGGQASLGVAGDPRTSTLIDARSTAWDAAREQADERLLFKAIPLAAVAVLALAVCALALLLQRRRAAYLDLRGQLLAAVTHELKTPLASIRAMAETLELRLADHPGARDYPRRIVASSERLAFLVDNVLSFARLERDAWKPRLAPLAVADLASWLASDPVARAVRPVDFSAEIPAGLTLVGDPDLVRLMLSNLLDNAAKYATGERIHVSLRAYADQRGVHLVVADDGPGLGTLDPRTLFSDFQRGHVEGVRGTGLGLSICKMVMTLHGGTIAVAPATVGTAFVATFPTRARPAADLIAKPALSPSSQ